ncbi:Periplasmic thiol:disulfide interchange protein DsbA [Candidatus Rhodobacter oscarellae]|uniref:Periplasmic thiol:disulfide interchange protein DsbA n=1 Tax=Candidatus Rhodobacter oscarellae TaxID=1675527 RepID=A0A0J9ED33_9RHOB|nr:DsbA family protein [Candidatus Rhodobacter lobularis]KMW60596.1 Periplasmic thiol:disulfide interchange protein DsbA [Candidatus Rhodobacter lobularis]
MDRRYFLVAGAAAIAAGGAYFWPANSTTSLPGLGAANAQEAGEVDTSIVAEMSLGDPNAPVTVVEYASYTCPHCRSFHENTFKDIKAAYIDTGKVHFIYREVYFDRFGLWAAMVARCGGPERYFALADMIYAQQSDWARGDTPTVIVDKLKKIGLTAGLTPDELDACMQNEDMARAMVAVFQENSERDSIRSTPSFLINGDLVAGDKSFEEFSALLDEKLG